MIDFRLRRLKHALRRSSVHGRFALSYTRACGKVFTMPSEQITHATDEELAESELPTP